MPMLSDPAWLDPAYFDMKAEGLNQTGRWVDSPATDVAITAGAFAGTLYLIMHVGPNPTISNPVEAYFYVRTPGASKWISPRDPGFVHQGTGDFSEYVAYKPSRDADAADAFLLHQAHYPFGVNEHGSPEVPLWDYPGALELSVHQPPYSQWEIWEQTGTPPAEPFEPPERDCPPRPDWPYEPATLAVGDGPATVMRLR